MRMVPVYLYILCFFFFSSRRRHTRCSRDWSSDVCSSDLDAAIPALVTGVADLAPDGGEATLTETLSFFETYGYHPTDITVATGAFDVAGRSNRDVVLVHAANPPAGLTMPPLDRGFRAQRRPGLRGFKRAPS